MLKPVATISRKASRYANEPVNNYSVRQMMFFGFDVVADRAVKDGD